MILYFRCFWILALLEGIERSGQSPIEIKRFNSLAYIANAVAKCYQIEPLEAKVLKEREGPLYPSLLWDTDRLVGMGLVTVSDLVIRNSGGMRSVSYAISESGLSVLQRCSSANAELMRLAEGLRNVAVACARNPKAMQGNNLLSRDGNYANTKYGIGDVVDFGVWDQGNSTQTGVERVLEITGEDFSKSPSTGINTYMQYLAFDANTAEIE